MVSDNTKITKQWHVLVWYDFSYTSVGKGRVSADVCFPRAETFLTAFRIILLKIEETWFAAVTVFSLNMFLERHIRVLFQLSQMRIRDHWLFILQEASKDIYRKEFLICECQKQIPYTVKDARWLHVNNRTQNLYIERVVIFILYEWTYLVKANNLVYILYT